MTNWGSGVATRIRDVLRAVLAYLRHRGRGRWLVRRIVEVENAETGDVLEMPVMMPARVSWIVQQRIVRAAIRRAVRGERRRREWLLVQQVPR